MPLSCLLRVMHDTALCRPASAAVIAASCAHRTSGFRSQALGFSSMELGSASFAVVRRQRTGPYNPSGSRNDAFQGTVMFAIAAVGAPISTAGPGGAATQAGASSAEG